MSEETVKSGFTPENILYTPDNIVNFISMIGARWKPEKILDPACGSGSFFPEIASLMDCPGCGRLSLYFYNSQTTNGLKYISYQDEPHDQIKKFEDSMMSIDDLIDYKKY